MIDRRRLIHAALATAVLPAGMLVSSEARAQSFQRFFPLLVELQGWKGGKPDGAAVEIAGHSMVTATREYRRGEARVNAQVILGPAAQGALTSIQSGLKIETSDARMSTSTIDGLPVARTFTIKDKSGAVLVAIGDSAVFSLSFNGIDDDEGLTLARKFDWKALQAAVAK
jgi:hypothetical protein